MSRRWRCAAVLVLVSGCGGDDAEHGGEGGHQRACGGQGETYVAGLARATTDERAQVVIDDALPAPPARFDNRLSVTVRPLADGARPVAAAVSPWMPEHGHGTSIVDGTPTAAAGGDALGLTFSPVTLSMPGLWELRFSVTDADGTVSRATFAFCVED